MAAATDSPLGNLYDQHGLWMFRTARSLVRSAADAEDLVQDVFISLVRSGLDPQRILHPRAYLATALTRAAAAWQRRRRPHVPLTDEAARAGEDPSDSNLDALLASLPDAQRQVVALKVEADLTFAEIATVLCISPNTAASRWRLACTHLRQHLPAPERTDDQ